MTDLWAAIDRLEGGKRWGKGQLKMGQSYCVLGALQAARGVRLTEVDEYPEPNDPDVLALIHVIHAQYPERKCHEANPIADAFCFNDDLPHDDTGFEQLRVVMQKAAISRDEILS